MDAPPALCGICGCGGMGRADIGARTGKRAVAAVLPLHGGGGMGVRGRDCPACAEMARLSGGLRRPSVGISRRLYLCGADGGRSGCLSEGARRDPAGRGLRMLLGRGVSDATAGAGRSAGGAGDHRRRNYALSLCISSAKARAAAGCAGIQNCGGQPQNAGGRFPAGALYASGARPAGGIRRDGGVSQDLLRSDDSECVLVGQQLPSLWATMCARRRWYAKSHALHFAVCLPASAAAAGICTLL